MFKTELLSLFNEKITNAPMTKLNTENDYKITTNNF